MRSIFGPFPTDRVKLIKKDGTIIDDIEALINPNKIFIQDASINIEEDDIIERTIPSGSKEQFIVTERGFYRGRGSIPDHYQAKVVKLSSNANTAQKQIVNNYNIKNADKININSTDNSVTYNLTDSDLSLISTLQSLAKGLENESEIIKSIDEMQNNIGKKTFIEKYNAFIQSVANHMTVFAPFIPALTDLLNKTVV